MLAEIIRKVVRPAAVRMCFTGALLVACIPQAPAGRPPIPKPVRKGVLPESAVQGSVLDTITLDQMTAIMKKEGYSVKTDERGVILWKLDGINAQMFVAKDGHSLQFHSAFGDGNATLKKVNKWNRTKRYSRTYLDDEGDPHLELDLDLAGGVSRNRIIDFLRTCRLSLVLWVQEVVK